MWAFRFLILMGMLGGLACQTELERQNIPLYAGITVDQSCNAIEVALDIEVYKEYGLSGWVLEIPMTLDPIEEGTDVKYYERHSLDTLIALFKKNQFPYSLSFNLENPHNYPLHTINVEQYLIELSGILLRTQKYLPEKLMFMGLWLDTTVTHQKLANIIYQFKDSFEEFEGEIVYGLFPHQLELHADWETPDMIGIRYHPPEADNIRPFFLQTNKQISQILQKHGKKGFIMQANLIGEQKVDLFQNQLRFWSSGIEIEGLTLNTLYCRLSLSDEGNYFALSKEEELKSMLKAYAR